MQLLPAKHGKRRTYTPAAKKRPDPPRSPRNGAVSQHFTKERLMTTKTTIVVTAVFNPDHMQAAQEYMQRAIPMLIDGGGEIIRRVKVTRSVIGENKNSAFLVMDFPSENAVDAIFSSEAYAEIIPLRDMGFKSLDIVCANPM
jgi:uncharacterized protein (DUF1330 family)